MEPIRLLLLLREYVARGKVMPWLEVGVFASAAALCGAIWFFVKSQKMERERIRRSEKRRIQDAEALRGWQEMEAELRRAPDA